QQVEKRADEVERYVIPQRPAEPQRDSQRLPAQAAHYLGYDIAQQGTEPPPPADPGQGPGDLGEVNAPDQHGQQCRAAEKANVLLHGTSSSRSSGSDPIWWKGLCCSSAMSICNEYRPL